MKFKVGDKVKFLNDVGGGTVSRVLDDKKVTVLNEDGFDIPVMASELIIEEAAESIDDEIEEIEENIDDETIDPNEGLQEDFSELEEIIQDEDNTEDAEQLKPNDDITVCFSFIPSEPVNLANSELDTYLINDSNYKMLYNISLEEDKQYKTIKSGYLEANTKVYIETYTKEYLSKHPDFLFQFIFYKTNLYDFKEPLHIKTNIHPMNMYDPKNFTINDFFEERAIIYTLINEAFNKEINKISGDEIEKIINQKEKPEKKIISLANDKKHMVREIDLHIHELVEDESGFSDKDKLDLQLVHFRRALDEAIDNKEKKIIFIHGKGNGRLKHEIRRIIDNEYDHCNYQDASFSEYGFGATLVILKS